MEIKLFGTYLTHDGSEAYVYGRGIEIDPYTPGHPAFPCVYGFVVHQPPQKWYHRFIKPKEIVTRRRWWASSGYVDNLSLDCNPHDLVKLIDIPETYKNYGREISSLRIKLQRLGWIEHQK